MTFPTRATRELLRFPLCLVAFLMLSACSAQRPWVSPALRGRAGAMIVPDSTVKVSAVDGAPFKTNFFDSAPANPSEIRIPSGKHILTLKYETAVGFTSAVRYYTEPQNIEYDLVDSHRYTLSASIDGNRVRFHLEDLTASANDTRRSDRQSQGRQSVEPRAKKQTTAAKKNVSKSSKKSATKTSSAKKNGAKSTTKSAARKPTTKSTKSAKAKGAAKASAKDPKSS